MIVQDDRPVEQNIDRVILPVGSPWWMVRGRHGLIDFQSHVRMEMSAAEFYLDWLHFVNDQIENKIE